MQDVQRLQKEDEGVAFVLREAERILGGTFTSYDTATLAWLVSGAGLSPEVLVTVIEYCSSIGHGKLRYIQKVALEWLDAGISTVEMAEERIRALAEKSIADTEREIYGGRLGGQNENRARNSRPQSCSERERILRKLADAWAFARACPRRIRTLHRKNRQASLRLHKQSAAQLEAVRNHHSGASGG